MRTREDNREYPVTEDIQENHIDTAQRQRQLMISQLGEQTGDGVSVLALRRAAEPWTSLLAPSNGPVPHRVPLPALPNAG